MTTAKKPSTSQAKAATTALVQEPTPMGSEATTPVVQPPTPAVALAAVEGATSGTTALDVMTAMDGLAPGPSAPEAPAPATPTLEAARVYAVGSVPIRHDGRFYDVGDKVFLTASQAARLANLVVAIPETSQE